MDYGFTKDQVIKMAHKTPSILACTIERTNDILDNLTDYGFTKPQVIKMAHLMPPILACTIERTNDILDNLTDYGFTKPQIIKMVYKMPPILGCSIKRTSKQIEWFRHHKILVDLVENPFRLIMSIKTLEARRQELEKLDFDYIQNDKVLFKKKETWENFIVKLRSQNPSFSSQ